MFYEKIMESLCFSSLFLDFSTLFLNLWIVFNLAGINVLSKSSKKLGYTFIRG